MNRGFEVSACVSRDPIFREGCEGGGSPSQKSMLLARQRGFGTFSFWEDKNDGYWEESKAR
jgi:hypothetical protein